MTAGAQISLFDELPAHEDIPTHPATIYAKQNERHGHLLIESDGNDYVFTNMGTHVTFGHFSGPTVQLTADNLDDIGNYCLRMATRLRTADTRAGCTNPPENQEEGD